LFSLFLQPPSDCETYLIAELAECGTTGIIEEDGGIRAFFEDSIDAGGLQREFAGFAPQLRREEPIDWVQVTRDAWPPLMVGERFFLVPPWRKDEPAPAGRTRLEICPGMACGTGRHPATQLCLRAIERYVRPGKRVLDVGTGSGILACASTLMGAKSVMGCDVDPEAIESARKSYESPLFFVGSAEAVHTGWADVIVANIDSAALELLAPELVRVRNSDSIYILSGFPVGDVPAGFEPLEILTQDEWLCWIV
jgi:ribosomal protein L11 methyltransferase